MNIRFSSLASGSSGNCIFVETDSTKVLVDCGLTGKDTINKLEEIGVDPLEIDAIFITHEHIDHVKGAGIVSRKLDIPIYANEKTWDGMIPILKKIRGSNIKTFDEKKSFQFKDFNITPVPLFHDSACPNGFIFETENKKVSIVTDTGIITEDMQNLMKDSDLYYIEANYDENMLKTGPYPWSLKQRILSPRGHLSNSNAAEILKKLLRGKREIVMLSHLSKENNTPKVAYNYVRKSLEEIGMDFEKDCILEISPRYSPTKKCEPGG